MRVSKIICLAVAVILPATATCADEISIVKDILGPEGPLYVDGNLYYVGWISHTLSKWDGKRVTVLNHTPGCGHNGLALTKRKTFLLACTEEQERLSFRERQPVMTTTGRMIQHRDPFAIPF